MPLFNTQKLIKEVERRRPLWDPSSEHYTDREFKKQCWLEITNVFSDDQMTEYEKRELRETLIKKWKNVRTSFARELHRQAGTVSSSTAMRKRPYIYFDYLQFLISCTHKKINKNELFVDDDLENFDEDEIDELTPQTNSIKCSPSPDPLDQNSTTDKRVGSPDSLENTTSSGILKKRVSRSPDLLKHNVSPDISKKMRFSRDDESYNKRSQYSERFEEIDSDRLFMLSLLEDFRKIPENRKLMTKAEIIHVIKRAQENNQTNYYSRLESYKNKKNCRNSPAADGESHQT